MNKLKALVTAVVVAFSSTALAAPATLSASVRGSFSMNGSWSTGTRSESQVRDHRNGGLDAQVRDHRNTNAPVGNSVQIQSHDYRDYRGPSVYVPGPRSFDWTELGVRSGSSPSYVQPPRDEQFGYLLLKAEQGRPALDSIWVRYFDGRQYQIDASSLRITSQGVVVPLQLRASTIHQIIFYPSAGSTGSFTSSVAY